MTRKVSRRTRVLSAEERARLDRKVERVAAPWMLHRDGSMDQWGEWRPGSSWSGHHCEFRCVDIYIGGQYRKGRLKPFTWMLSSAGDGYGAVLGGWSQPARGTCKSLTDALEQATPRVRWVAREGFRRMWSRNLHPVFQWDREARRWVHLLTTPSCAYAFVRRDERGPGLQPGVYATAEDGWVTYTHVSHWGSGSFSFTSEHDLKDAPGIVPLEWEVALAILEASGDHRVVGLLKEEAVPARKNREALAADRAAMRARAEASRQAQAAALVSAPPAKGTETP